MQKKILKDYRFWTFAFCVILFTVVFAFDFAKFSLPTTKSYGKASCAFIYLATVLPFLTIFFCSLAMKNRGKSLLYTGLFLLLSFVLRILFADFISHDYRNFLVHWVAEYRGMSITECFVNQVGNYPPLYNYFLILFSRINLKDMYLIKVLSLYSECALYFFVAKLIALVRKEKFSFVIFSALTLIPTFLIDSSQWGQCDAMYTACAVAGVYFALKRNSIACFLAMGLGLAFKMQILLIFPAGLIFLLAKDTEGKKYLLWRWIWILPLTFILLSSLPVCFGGSFFKVFKVYINQAVVGNNSGLNLHCANILLPLTTIPKDSVAYYVLLVLFILITAFVDIFAVVWSLKRSKGILDREQLVFLSLTISLLSVFFMPKMVDRFFHIAEIFAFIYFAIKRDKNSFLMPILIETGQMTMYMYVMIHVVGPYLVSPLLTGFALALVAIRFFKYFPCKRTEKLVALFDPATPIDIDKFDESNAEKTEENQTDTAENQTQN